MAVDTQGPTIMAVAIVFGVVAAITLSLRLWARVFLVKQMGFDDVLISIAVLLSWAFMAACIAAVQHGMGMHIEAALAHEGGDLTAYSEIVWFSSIFYNACLGFIKISVLALYMRLGDRTLRRLAVVMIVVVGCQASGNVFAAIFQCTPVAAAYDQSITDKKCININAFYLANAAVNIFTDLLTYTLPIKLILNLQMPRRQKIGLAVILCLGLFACVSSIIRITFIPQMLTAADATYVISGAMYWSVIEINVGILAASIPSFKPIASRYAPRLLGSSYNRSRSGGKGGVGGQYHHGSSYLKSSGLGRSKNGTMELRSVERGDRFGLQSGVNRTEVGKGSDIGMGHSVLDDNSSEEALYTPPKGQIGVKTQIETTYAER
ncbi:integral membrane protein [Pestalotiopsis sp. NC0098]|nr:integral membrane protein [Pestalotiopsis sp. NC0098]